MSGHNKWSSIKHKKGAADAKRGKIFSRVSKEIIMAAKEGGGDPALNARLRSAVAAAKAANMPNDNIDRAIKKGVGGGEGTQLDSLTYEGYAAGGVAVIVNCLTLIPITLFVLLDTTTTTRLRTLPIQKIYRANRLPIPKVKT